MTVEFMLPVAQAMVVFFLAAWLTMGVFENIVHSDLNGVFTAEVLDMGRMREDFPEAYASVAYRRISNPGLQRWIFRLIVMWELLAVLALWVGFVWLVAAIGGAGDLTRARAAAMLGVMLFTGVWSGFLVAGNWFCYWFCHEGAQNTHYQMTLWGMSGLILLAIG